MSRSVVWNTHGKMCIAHEHMKHKEREIETATEWRGRRSEIHRHKQPATTCTCKHAYHYSITNVHVTLPVRVIHAYDFQIPHILTNYLGS